jgi:hypothetical protein
LLGIEIKATRTDWKLELAKPEKQERFGRHCHAWVVATVPGVVRVEELPAGMGLWEWNDAAETWRTVRKPTVHARPAYVQRAFMTALLRRGQSTMPAARYLARVTARIFEEARQRTEKDLTQAQTRAQRLEQERAALTKALHDAGFYWNPFAHTLHKRETA